MPEMAEQRAKDAALSGGTTGEEVPAPEIGLRVLLPAEQDLAYERALAFARKRGCEKADNTDPSYNLGLSVYMLALSGVDPDSDPRAPEPFFGESGDVESAVHAILHCEHLTRDGIIYLAEAQELWQNAASPQAMKLGPKRLWELVGELAASEDPKVWLSLEPATRWIFARTMAVQLVSLLMDRSPSGETAPESTSNGKSPDPSASSGPA